MIGWLGLGAYIVAYDTWAILRGHQTLSSAFYEALRHPTRKWYVVLAWAALSAHLYGLDKYRLGDIRRLVERSSDG